MSNPVPILCDHFHYNLKGIHRASSLGPVKPETLQNWYHSHTIKPFLKRRLFMSSMVTWGMATAERQNKSARDLLWKCYFPDTEPHIYHILMLVFGLREIDDIGLNSKVLRQSTLTPMQLKLVGKSSLNMADSLISPKRKEGPDYIAARHILNALKVLPAGLTTKQS